MLHELVEESFVVEGGFITFPDSPGLEITPREDFMARYAGRTQG